MAHVPYETAYPRVEILPSSRNWWAKLKGTAAECIHTRVECAWIAALLPDTLYLRGKRAPRRDPVRPEISLCRECLLDTIHGELEEFDGRVVAFEPNPELFTQYFFVATPDFEAAGVAPETASAIEQRLTQTGETCANARGQRPGCGCRGKRWLVLMKQIRYAENSANGFALRMARENWPMRSRESPRPMCSI